jgi:hypothetical protein
MQRQFVLLEMPLTHHQDRLVSKVILEDGSPLTLVCLNVFRRVVNIYVCYP